MLPYANPAISALSVFRCTADGIEDESGDYVGIAYAYTIASVSNKNTAASRMEYKRTTLTEWTELMSGSDYAVNTTVYPAQELLSDYQWDIRLTVSDFFGSTAMTVTLPSAEVLLDLLASGRGIAIGKTAELEDTMDVKWMLRLLGGLTINNTGVADFVAAQGVSGNWHYIKMMNGIAICARNDSFSGAYIGSQSGSIYTEGGGTSPARAYPFTFSSVPREVATIHGSNKRLWLLGTYANTASQTGVYMIASPVAYNSASTAASGSISIVAIGRWK